MSENIASNKEIVYFEAPNKWKFFVARKDARPVGVAALDVDTGEVCSILVESDQRRKGIATQLLTEIMKYAHSIELNRVWATCSEVNEPINKLLGNKGFYRFNKWEYRWKV